MGRASRPGRITSKFSATKWLALNETGLHNVVSLFLILAATYDRLGEMGPRLQNVLLQANLSKMSAIRQVALMRGHVAMLILFTRKRVPIFAYIPKILEQLSAVVQQQQPDDYDVTVPKLLADGFCEIYQHSDSFRLGEHLLIGLHQ